MAGRALQWSGNHSWRPIASGLAAAFTVTLSLHASLQQSIPPRLADTGGHSGSLVIFVDSRIRENGDGTASAPFPTIRQAIQRAREIRDRCQTPMVIRVAPGEYREDSLYLDVSNVELRGSTRLIVDERGRPQNCGTASAPTPCVERGTETVIAAVRPLLNGQVLLFVAPTRARGVDALFDITVRGFIFDGLSTNVATSGWGVFVDRVYNFAIQENTAYRVQIGVFTRLASGRIESNFAYNSNDGVAIAAGSDRYPARVDLRSNRMINHLAQAALALGAGGSQTFVNDPYLLPIQTVFDPARHPEEVPDKLELTLVDNDISHNPSFGFRFENYASGPVYDTTDNQPVSSNITAIVRHNSFTDNGEYGVTVEGAFAARNNPRRFTGSFTGVFEDNDFSRSGRAGMFAGFMLIGVVTRNPGLINTNKYLVDSRFTIVMDASAREVDYDNPILDPFDRLTLLNNILVVNGASLRDRRVTCPPGFPCAP